MPPELSRAPERPQALTLSSVLGAVRGRVRGLLRAGRGAGTRPRASVSPVPLRFSVASCCSHGTRSLDQERLFRICLEHVHAFRLSRVMPARVFRDLAVPS